jgi:nucleotide-binding universal stress UspA family protein
MRILFAYDGSESADAAIATAATLLGRDNADAVVLTVWERRSDRDGRSRPDRHRRFFGSVSTHILQHASRPVLVVPLQNGTRPADALTSSRDSAQVATAATSDQGRSV